MVSWEAGGVSMPFHLIEGDITHMKVDVIVNAANIGLTMGGGVCGAVFSAAGAEALTNACRALAPIETGEVAITDGFALHAKRIIHAAGPVYRGGAHGEAELLASCYTGSLEVCLREGLNSIAFPLISSGIYGYPVDDAYRVARAVILDFLSHHDLEVYLVILSASLYRHLSMTV